MRIKTDVMCIFSYLLRPNRKKVVNQKVGIQTERKKNGVDCNGQNFPIRVSFCS